MAEQPVQNCIDISHNQNALPPRGPTALRIICAAGIPVPESVLALKSHTQKEMVMFSRSPMTPVMKTACVIATGPRFVSSEICVVASSIVVLVSTVEMSVERSNYKT